MPKKETISIQANQRPAGIPNHMKSSLRNAASAVHHTSKSDEGVEAEEDEWDVEDGGDDNVMEMLSMLQEIQKYKASKTAAQSAAFQNKKTALFSESRKKVAAAVSDGFATIERARTTISELKAQETSQAVAVSTLKGILDTQADCIQGLLDQCTYVVEDLSHRRARQINDSSSMLEVQAMAREKSRARVYATATSQVAESLDNQKVAADATALIKHYQSLLLL